MPADVPVINGWTWTWNFVTWISQLSSASPNYYSGTCSQLLNDNPRGAPEYDVAWQSLPSDEDGDRGQSVGREWERLPILVLERLALLVTLDHIISIAVVRGDQPPAKRLAGGEGSRVE